MGLDINAYSNLTWVNPQPTDLDAAYADPHLCHLRANEHYLARTDGLQTGFYHGTRHPSFRAGSYSGYNHWRNRLAQLALGLTDKQVWELKGEVKAFGELINFSDCEGIIGPLTSAKLAKDFQDNAATIQALLNPKPDDIWDEDTYFWELYQQWQAAFEAAANNGAVAFH